VDRAYLYFFNDSDQPQVHGSSGLTRHFQPKPSFHAAAHLQRTLGEFRFKRQFKAGEAAIAEFVHAQEQGRRIWVIWLPTGDGRNATIKLPPFEGKLEKAERMPLAANENTIVQLQGDSLTVTESPAYLFFK
jgi:hypothetical protein